MTLTQADVGKPYRICSLKGDSQTVLRLLELGFTKGEPIRLVGKAPFGSPLIVEILGAVLALRDSEAECLEVE